MIRRQSRNTSGWGDYTLPIPGDVIGSLQELDIEIARIANGEAWAVCPGHEARTGEPNHHPDKWSVNLESGQHSCFSCGFRGSFVYLVQEVLDYERHDAEAWVRSRGGIERLRRSLAASSDREFEEPRVPEWNEARLALLTSPPDSARAGRGVSAGAVEHYGVLWDKDKWILPIRDPDTGKLWGYQEKSETGWVSNKPDGVPKADTLFGLNCFTGSTMILLESPLDCLRLYTAGITGAVSSFGVQVSERQLELIFDRAETVVFALDNDAAGLTKMWDLRTKYLRSGRNVKFVNYSDIPKAKDLGESFLTDEDIQHAILKAKTMVFFRP